MAPGAGLEPDLHGRTNPLKCELAHICSKKYRADCQALGVAGGMAVTADDEPVICPICNRGRITKRPGQIAFRQMSDKGFVHCRVTLLIGTCDNCQAKSIDDEEALDDAFKQEYDKLP